MRWWRRRAHQPRPSEDAEAAVQQVQRAHQDTDRLLEHVGEVMSRADEAARRADEVRRRNHFGEAVEFSMRRVQHP